MEGNKKLNQKKDWGIRGGNREEKRDPVAEQQSVAIGL